MGREWVGSGWRVGGEWVGSEWRVSWELELELS